MTAEHHLHHDPAVRALIARERAAALREAADEIEAELICCDVFERRDQSKRNHSICYWGGAARRLMLDRANALTAEAEQ